MPRDGSQIYSPPPGTRATTENTIESSKYNAFVDDLAADLNTARPISAGGTGATSATAARAALGAVDAASVTTAVATAVTAAVSTDMSGRAYPRRSDGAAINIVWAGQGGTPGWIVGSDDGVNFRPYNPPGINVGSVGGWSQATIANQIEVRAQAWANTRMSPPYTGDWGGETNFPVGTLLLVNGAYPGRNAAVAFSPAGQVDKYITSGAAVAGTWRARGAAWSFDLFLAQRVG